MFRIALLSLVLVAPATLAAEASWIDQSNRHAQVLLDIAARYNPESAAARGVQGHDEEVLDLKPHFSERQETDLQSAIGQFETIRSQTADPLVKQDLDILTGAARDQKRSFELYRQLTLPFFDLAQAVFGGFQDLLDVRVEKERYQAALIRLRRYVGGEQGYQPITIEARARYEEAAQNSVLIGPWIVEVQRYLDNQESYLDGIQKLLQDSGLKGWQKDMRTLRWQFDEYTRWARASVLPRARKTHQMPAEVYANNLHRFGVQMDPHELINRALASYQQTLGELEPLARRVGEQRNWQLSDFRDVIRELKKTYIPDDELLSFYTARLAQIEAIVQRERLVTLPNRKVVIRLATEAESATGPTPHMDPPRLIGNTGEPAEFVLPTRSSKATSGPIIDDFSYDAIAWTLTAHEARPGHELQFARMLEQGVSTARVLYALNSANVEGWAMYAEGMLKQYLPLEGQIGTLQMRMVREARAFLDPMLNLGLIEPDAAKRFLMEEVMLSEPTAQQELERYTFEMPGQATAYFYGYSMLNALRTRVELGQAGRFDERRYHDFIVSQGPLPFDLLAKVVIQEFLGEPVSEAGAAGDGAPTVKPVPH